MRRHPTRAALVSLLLAASLTPAGVAPALAVAAPAGGAATPSVRLIGARDRLTVERFPGEPVYFDPAVVIAAVGGAFEIHAVRPDYRAVHAEQVIRGPGSVTRRPVPAGLVPTIDGMARFLRMRVVEDDGSVIVRQTTRFCPDGTDSRVSPGGPPSPRYPRSCFVSSPFLRGAVWGIQRGWAVSAFGWAGIVLDIPNGHHRLDIFIGGDWANFLSIPPQHQSVSIDLTVRRSNVACEGPCRSVGARPRASTAPVRGSLGVVPTGANPDPGTLPDLVALPAWDISTHHTAQGDFLQFAATVWNAGPAPLAVEGFRDGDEPVMDAWQYFFRGGTAVGRARVGAMEYDPRAGHRHWHFKQFARYSLLDSGGHRIVLSQKEAFCLAPTDAIDLTVRGAEWHPGATGLGTACGDISSVWTREVLQAGWGDTYVQSLPGQSFDITDVPNGSYLIAVTANPKGLLYERTRANDRELREVTLGGSPGARTVTVAPWHGIPD